MVGNVRSRRMALALWALLTVALGPGCREERPVAGNDATAATGPATESAATSPTSDPAWPDEPAVAVRKAQQAPGRAVVTVHPHLVTWIDGELAVGPDLMFRLMKMREQGCKQVVLVVAEGVSVEGWGQIADLLRQAFPNDDDRTIVFDQPGLGRPVSEAPAPPAPPAGEGSGDKR
jgi:hypothetical protein